MLLERQAAPPPWWWCLLCVYVVCCGLFWSSHSLHVNNYQNVTLRYAHCLTVRSIGITFWPTHVCTIPLWWVDEAHCPGQSGGKRCKAIWRQTTWQEEGGREKTRSHGTVDNTTIEGSRQLEAIEQRMRQNKEGVEDPTQQSTTQQEGGSEILWLRHGWF